MNKLVLEVNNLFFPVIIPPPIWASRRGFGKGATYWVREGRRRRRAGGETEGGRWEVEKEMGRGRMWERVREEEGSRRGGREGRREGSSHLILVRTVTSKSIMFTKSVMESLFFHLFYFHNFDFCEVSSLPRPESLLLHSNTSTRIFFSHLVWFN